MPENKIAICLACGREYTFSGISDGFCGFECWEKINCQTPQKRVESFDMSELFETKK